MSEPRPLLLFEKDVQPSSWNERMAAGEYAVHASAEEEGRSQQGPSCLVFESLPEAEAYAREQSVSKPELRYRIYDHQGFIGKPVSEFRGNRHKGGSEISARFRRWMGGGLFFGGMALVIYDWRFDFAKTWPATIGFRLLLPGLFLLVTEVVLVLVARRKARS